tara:strand:- start:7145 stop:8026 length:882 start_codon:yes stop_codon:yes gene_type:complete
MKNLFLKISLLISVVLTDDLDQCYISNDLSRVVVAGGSITEIIYFLDLDKYLTAVDVTSNYPDKAKNLPSIGYVRNLSTEGILSLNPTLFLGENDMGPPIVLEQLKETALDIRIIPEQHSANGILEKVYCVGEIMGLEISQIKDKTIDLNKNVNRLYELTDKGILKSTRVMFVLNMRGNSPIVAGKGTSGNGFISIIGCKNAFDNVQGWKPISEESVLNVNPDYIILPNKDIHKSSTIDNILDNPIFMNTEAGKNKNFIFEDAMAMLGFGPRTLDIAVKIAESISEKNKTYLE